MELFSLLFSHQGFPGGSDGKEICLQGRRPLFNSWVGRIPWRRDRLPTPVFLGFPGGSVVKESTLQYRRPGFNPRVGKIPWRSEWLPTLVFCLGEFHGQRSLAGYIVHRLSKGWTQLFCFIIVEIMG